MKLGVIWHHDPSGLTPARLIITSGLIESYRHRLLDGSPTPTFDYLLTKACPRRPVPAERVEAARTAAQGRLRYE
jgi:hypothetical protein